MLLTPLRSERAVPQSCVFQVADGDVLLPYFFPLQKTTRVTASAYREIAVTTVSAPAAPAAPLSSVKPITDVIAGAAARAVRSGLPTSPSVAH